MQFTNTVTIDKPTGDVFSFLAHFENIPTWNYAIAETRPVTDTPVAVGKVYRQMRSTPYPVEETFEVTRFESDRVLQIRGDFGPLHGTLTYELEERGATTVLSNTVDLGASGIASLVTRIGSHRVQQAMAVNLDALKRLLESSSLSQAASST